MTQSCNFVDFTIYKSPIGDLEEAFMQDRVEKPSLCVRYMYIDDLFMIWPHTREKLDSFLSDLNKMKQRI